MLRRAHQTGPAWWGTHRDPQTSPSSLETHSNMHKEMRRPDTADRLWRLLEDCGDCCPPRHYHSHHEQRPSRTARCSWGLRDTAAHPHSAEWCTALWERMRTAPWHRESRNSLIASRRVVTCTCTQWEPWCWLRHQRVPPGSTSAMAFGDH